MAEEKKTTFDTELEAVTDGMAAETASDTAEEDGKGEAAVAGETRMVRASKATRNRKEVLADARRREQEREQRNAMRQKFLAGWSGLYQAMRRETVMFGTVSSIDELPLSDTASEFRRTGIFVTIIYNNLYKIRIPFQYLYRRFPVDMNTVDLDTEIGVRRFILRQRAMSEKLYGLEIPFVITYMDADNIDPDEDYAIAASRAKALEIFERANYEPNAEGHALVEEGTFVNDARIISVADWSIQVNVKGVDTIIPVYNLTYKPVFRTTDLGDRYHVGDTISVEVLKIEKVSDGVHNIVVTAKPAELIRAQASPLSIHEGEMTIGTVTTIAESKNHPGQIVISIYLDFYDRPAFTNELPASRLGLYPQPGDKVRVTVRQIYDNGMIKVACRQMHGPVDLFTRQV